MQALHRSYSGVDVATRVRSAQPKLTASVFQHARHHARVPSTYEMSKAMYLAATLGTKSQGCTCTARLLHRRCSAGAAHKSVCGVVAS